MPYGERYEELPSLIGFQSGATVSYPGGLPKDLPLRGLLLACEGRMNLTQTAAGVIFPEAPQSIIRRIVVTGTKVGGSGSITPVNIRGEEAHIFTRLYHQCIPVGANLAAVPGSGGTAFPAPLASTATGTFDFRTFYWVPLSYLLSGVEDEVATLTDPNTYSQLDLNLSFGAVTGVTAIPFFISGGTFTNATLTAFGSASGSPSVRITRVAPLAAAAGFKKAMARFQVQTQSKKIGVFPGTTFADQKIADMPLGNRIRCMMFRQYAENATVEGLIDQAAGVSLARIGDNSNIGTFRLRMKLNGAEKFRMFWPDLQERNRYFYDQYSTLMPQGYGVVEFSQRGFPLAESFDTRGYAAAGMRLELFGDALTLAAADRVDLLTQEQIALGA